MTTTITLNVEEMTTESLYGLAHSLLTNSALVGKSLGTRRDTVRQVYTIIAVLESRAYGGDTSELRECVEGLERCVAKQKHEVRRTLRSKPTPILPTAWSKRLGKVTIPND